MKKILVYGRPYSNGGDFLIYDRIVKVLKAFSPECSIEVNLDNVAQFQPTELNEYDAIVTGGGGAQYAEPYVRTSFFYQHIDEITVPIHYMGTGLYGADGEDETIYDCQYSAEMIAYFNKVIERGGQIATRDWVVDTIMRNNGVNGAIMAGCPAWYDLDLLKKEEDDVVFQGGFAGREIRTIAISNHGLTKNMQDHGKKLKQIQSLIIFLQRTFPEAETLLTFNDGYITKYSRDYNLSLQKWASEHGVTCVDLSGDADKFKALDGIDLHIGFRVHTHIYCISQMIPSLLIEEDIRGYGMNETLCLPHIRAYAEHSKPDDFAPNPYLDVQLFTLLEQMRSQGRVDYSEVFRIIRKCYQTGMRRWLANVLM